jgi:hypothetical protein
MCGFERASNFYRWPPFPATRGKQVGQSNTLKTPGRQLTAAKPGCRWWRRGPKTVITQQIRDPLITVHGILDPWCQQYNYYDYLISCILMWCLFNSHGLKTLWLLLTPSQGSASSSRRRTAGWRLVCCGVACYVYNNSQVNQCPKYKMLLKQKMMLMKQYIKQSWMLAYNNDRILLLMVAVLWW